MNKSFITDIKTIRDAIDSQKLVVFAGAGISLDAGVPKWEELIDSMKSDIEIPREEKDYLRIAQMYFNDRQQKEYIEKVRQVLKHKKSRYNSIHEEIFKLNPEHILTTNYDDLLEQVIKRQSLPFSIIKKDRDFPYAKNTKHLVKIHGDLDDTDIVLKEDDYIDYSLNHPLIEGFIKSVFVSKIVLFIGYSFSDINLKMIIQDVRNILGKDFQNAYLLNLDEDFHPAQREYLKNKGVKVINYHELNRKGENYITSFLSGQNALGFDYYQKDDSLSEKGQQLLNFIRFIVNYDKFNEELSSKHLIDQVYYSINRFSELKTLPQYFIANLYPFHNSVGYNYNAISRFSLLVKNKKLVDLFFKEIIYNDNGEIVFSPIERSKYSENDIELYNQKIERITKVLNYSLIYYLSKEGTNPDSFGNYGWSSDSQKLQLKKGDKCDCLNCRYFNNKINDTIKEILSSEISEASELNSDFQLAYGNYNIGNFVKSFHQFEEIANKAWESGKYISYYIAKHNLKTLNNLIDYESNINKEQKLQILKKIEDIDFDILFSQIPHIGKPEYELLRIIRDDDVLNKAENEINDCLNKAKDLRELYSRGGSSSGPYYPDIINIELYKTKYFYVNNFIISDVFKEFRAVCNSAVEALIILNSISDNYKQKLKKFDSLFFKIATQYGYTRKIEESIDRYQIKSIEFNENDLLEVVELTNTYLKSFYNDRNFFGSDPLPRNTIKQQLSNRFFSTKCREKFSNTFLIFSLVKFDLEQGKKIIEHLIPFLTVEDFLYHNELKQLSKFIKHNAHLFDEITCSKLLKLIANKYGILNGGDLLDAIEVVYKTNNLNKYSNRELLLKILYSEANNNRLYYLISLWNISDKNLQEIVSQEIEKSLTQKFNSDLYIRATNTGIFDYKKYIDNYIEYVNQNKGQGNYIIEGEKVIPDSYIFIYAMSFLYGIKEMKVNISEKFTDLSSYMQFYLNPENYDYSQFKSEWLLFLRSPVFYQRFSKIKPLVKIVKQDLSENYNSKLSEIYFKYFV